MNGSMKLARALAVLVGAVTVAPILADEHGRGPRAPRAGQTLAG